jgi:Tol biopolymer transport system component
LSLLPVGVDVNYQTISPDGKWLAMVASAANQANVYLYSIDELAREPAVAKQLTSTPGFKTSLQFSPDSKELFYLENGRIGVVNLEGRNRPLAVAAEMDGRLWFQLDRGYDSSLMLEWMACNRSGPEKAA